MTIVDNPAGRTPHALNLAIDAARHDILVRVDGHGELGERYIERAVQLLAETGAANVGGVMEAHGQTPFEEAVAFVYTSRFGFGGAAFHQGDVPAGPADTVFLGVFDKSRAEGGRWLRRDHAPGPGLGAELSPAAVRPPRVWFSPELRVTYRPRSTLKALINQMYDTGKWRREVVRRHPDTASVRYLAPPAAVVAIGVGSVAAVLGRVLGPHFLQLGALAPVGYGAFVGYVTAAAPASLSPQARRWLPAVLAATHLAWGAASWSAAADVSAHGLGGVSSAVGGCRPDAAFSVSRRRTARWAVGAAAFSVSRRDPQL